MLAKCVCFGCSLSGVSHNWKAGKSSIFSPFICRDWTWTWLANPRVQSYLFFCLMLRCSKERDTHHSALFLYYVNGDLRQSRWPLTMAFFMEILHITLVIGKHVSQTRKLKQCTACLSDGSSDGKSTCYSATWALFCAFYLLMIMCQVTLYPSAYQLQCLTVKSRLMVQDFSHLFCKQNWVSV